MRRLVLLAVAALALAVPAGASAEQPTREFFPTSDFTLGPEYCGFTLQVDVVKNNAYILTKSNGDQIITGSLVFRLTNTETGQSMTVNVGGPGFFDADTGTFTLSGKGFVFLLPGQLPGVDQPIVWLTSGPVIISSSGLETHGTQTDVCALLS
jgi:hypothetical protein